MISTQPRLGPQFLRASLGGNFLLLPLILICLAFYFLAPNFATGQNIENILRLAAIIIIIGVGQTFVMTSANIDLSVRWMSAGQRQATAIVRTVFWGKRLLILDEPTAALGVDESEHALRTIDSLRRQGIPMLVVSHNLQHVFRMSDRIVVLRHGRVQADLVTADTSPEDVVGHITGAKVTEVERRAARVEAGV